MTATINGTSPCADLPLGSFSKVAQDAILSGDFQLHALSTDTSVAIGVGGRHLLTYAGGVLALVLPAPVKGTDDGKYISFLSASAEAHTVTCTGHLIDGNAHSNVMTLAAHPGAGFEIVAYQGNWYVTSANFATGS